MLAMCERRLASHLLVSQTSIFHDQLKSLQVDLINFRSGNSRGDFIASEYRKGAREVLKNHRES